MFNLIYISRETAKFTPTMLVELLDQSRQKNKLLGITGLLLYRGGNFMQVLEGEESTVLGVYDSIRRDARHYRVVTVLQEGIDKRAFPDWTMGFRQVGLKDSDLPEGYSAFLENPWELLEEPTFPDSVSSFLRLFILSTKRGHPPEDLTPR